MHNCDSFLMRGGLFLDEMQPKNKTSNLSVPLHPPQFKILNSFYRGKELEETCKHPISHRPSRESPNTDQSKFWSKIKPKHGKASWGLKTRIRAWHFGRPQGSSRSPCSWSTSSWSLSTTAPTVRPNAVVLS